MKEIFLNNSGFIGSIFGIIVFALIVLFLKENIPTNESKWTDLSIIILTMFSLIGSMNIFSSIIEWIKK